jgi:L-ascorbate metabolism protein UlaG (beta-lactamase superfamily)
MILSMRDKIILGSFATLVVVAILSQYMYSPAAPANVEVNTKDTVEVTLLTNAGIMIEAKDTRIYIDPIDLPQEYRDLKADAILITHDHSDHYQYATINMLQKEDTMNVFPAIMDNEIRWHHGVAVAPGDEFEVGEIKVTAYYMYTLSPDPNTPASHPAESRYTSYIIDIDGFTIFHAGDSKNIPEYEELTDKISVALLPLGPGCQTMYGEEVVDVVQVIQPEYMIPIHYTDDSYRQFNSIYKRSVEALTDCTVCSLEYFSSYSFEIG